MRSGDGCLPAQRLVFVGLVSVYEFDEVAAAVARVAGIVAQVAEPTCVSVLELDAVEGWLGVGGGLGEA